MYVFIICKEMLGNLNGTLKTKLCLIILGPQRLVAIIDYIDNKKLSTRKLTCSAVLSAEGGSVAHCLHPTKYRRRRTASSLENARKLRPKVSKV